MICRTWVTRVCWGILVLMGTRSLQAAGVDMPILHGSRIIALGGQQISLAKDAYAPFYNPAALAFIKRSSAVASFEPIFTQYSAPIGSAGNEKKGEVVFGPLFYLGTAYRLNDSIVTGLAVYPTNLIGGKITGVNFGGAFTDSTIEGRLVRIEIAPSLSFQMNEELSVGISWRVGYNQFDSKGGIYEIPSILPATRVDASFSGWDAKGFKIGAHWRATENTDLAFSWRPSMKTDLDGDVTINAGTTLDSKYKLVIPHQLQFSLAHDFGELLLAATYEYTLNSEIKESRFRTPGAAALLGTDEIVTPFDFRDGHTLHLGAEYAFDFRQNDELALMLGFVWDHTVTNPTRPYPVYIPPAPYLGYSIGTQWRRENQEVGFAFHTGGADKNVKSLSNELTPNTVFTGKYEGRFYLVALDYQIYF